MEQKVAIVTAASKGMGAACAKELSQKGFNLVLMARGEEVISLADDLKAVPFQGSVTEASDLEKLVETTLSKFGRIDAVVNSTGHPAKGDLLDLSDSDWHNGLDMVMLNVARMARLVTPTMEKQASGSIVNISTFAAFEPSPSFPISSVLRAALAGYTKLFSDQYAGKGIRMNNILPGFIDSYEVSEDILDKIPMHRSGTVAEIAKTTSFLLSEDAGYITGQNIRVDGGITRSV